MDMKEKPREISESSHDINLERIRTYARKNNNNFFILFSVRI
jgi:hypothetical protein